MDYRKTDPEFMERAERFAFEEVVNEPGQELDAPTRWLAILAALVGCQGLDAFRTFLPKALDEGLSPVWVKEMVYQSADYVGLGRMWPFLGAANEALEARGIALPACGEATTTMESRLERGVQAQVDIFGPQMLEAWKNGPVNRWLAANCFGDYYTRTGLDLKQREMITFCFLLAQGGCESQLVSHAVANLRIGNDKRFLIKVVSQCLPYIGYPRSLNAIRCIYEAADKVEEKDFKKDASLPSEESFSKST